MDLASELHSDQEQLHKKETSLLIAVSSTFLSLIPTAYVALSSNSIVLTADFLRCASEFAAIFLSWLIMRRVSRGSQNYYDYGFGRLEQLASLAVAAALFISFCVVIVLGIHRISHPQVVENAFYGLIFAILSVIGNLFMCFYNKMLSKNDSSPILESQLRLFVTKALASVVVMVSLLIAIGKLKSPLLMYADPIGSLILAGFLLFNAIQLLTTSMDDLLDRSVDEAVRLIILKILVENEANYLGLSSIRSRRAGKKSYIYITLQFPGEKQFTEIFQVMENLRKEIAGAISKSEVTIIPQLG